MKPTNTLDSRFGRAVVFAAALALLQLPHFAHAIKTKKPSIASVLPVVLTGTDVPAMVGTRVDQVSVFACKNGKPAPIRSQVDEINESGRVVSRFGKAANVPPDATPGIIDADDELVLMLSELGEPCEPEMMKMLRGELHEVKVEATHLNEPAYAYVLLGQEFPTPKALVRYEPGEDIVKSSAYAWGFDREKPWMFNFMQFNDLTGNKPSRGVLDRTKARFKVKSLAQVMVLNFTEENIESALEGVRVGPVRIVRELDVELKFIPGLEPDANVTYYQYERYLHFVVRFKLPRQAAVFLSSMELRVGFDFSDLRGLRFSTKALPQGTLIDGQTIAGEDVIPFGDEPWFMLSGRGVNLVAGVDWPREINVEPNAFFIDDLKASNPPERVPGSMPMVGYVLTGWEGLGAQWYTVTGTVAMLPGFPEGGGSGYFKLVREAPKVSVRPVEMPTAQ
ncbi:MAG: hypothetical protein KDH09_02260 [Chrysiogenetes bacterium]|nr:hypothetical protein [Chrysiogenetes bacterium]